MQQQLTIEDLLFGEVKGTQPVVETLKTSNISAGDRKVLLLLDGPNILHRAYYATSAFPEKMAKAPDGRYVNGVLHFLQMINQYFSQLHPTHTAICWDEGTSWRNTVYPEYKDGRKGTPSELKEQFPILRDILSKIGISTFSSMKYEADDYIASLKETFLNKFPNGEVFIVSNDQDLLQLIDKKTTVIARKSKEDIFYDPEQFKKDYFDFEPSQIIDYKSICGDPSDNIKGIPGIGKKGAIDLLTTYRNIDNLLENKDTLEPSFKRYHKKLSDEGHQAVFCKKLTTLVRDIEEINTMNLDQLNLNINIEAFIKICIEFQFVKLQNKIETGKWNF